MTRSGATGELTSAHYQAKESSSHSGKPGDEIRVWEREQGDIALRIEAGVARHPETNRWVELGLPFGPKVRLILAHLNREALRTGSPEIEVEHSLTAFVRRLQDPTQRGKSGPSGSLHPGIQGATHVSICCHYPHGDEDS